MSRVRRQILADAGAPFVETHPSMFNYGVNPRRSYENPGHDRYGVPGFAHDGVSMTINSKSTGSRYVIDPVQSMRSSRSNQRLWQSCPDAVEGQLSAANAGSWEHKPV